MRYPASQASFYAYGTDDRGSQGEIRPSSKITNRSEYVERYDINCACLLSCLVVHVNVILSHNLEPPGETSGQEG